MEISIKGLYTLILISIFTLIMTSLLVLNVNYYQVSKITLSIVDNIQDHNGLDEEMISLINDYASENGVEATVSEIDYGDGKKYKVVVKYKAEIKLLGYIKEFSKTKVTRMLY